MNMKIVLQYFLVSTLCLSGAIPHLAIATPQAPITIEIPKSWQLLKSGEMGGTKSTLYEIPNSQARVGIDPYSNALILETAKGAPASLANLESLADSRMASIKATKIFSVADGTSWKSMIYALAGKEHLIYLYRIGLVRGTSIEAFISFPIIPFPQGKNGKFLTLGRSSTPNADTLGLFCNPEVTYELVEQFNELTDGVKIFGVNSNEVRAILIDPPANAQYYVRSPEIAPNNMR